MVSYGGRCARFIPFSDMISKSIGGTGIVVLLCRGQGKTCAGVKLTLGPTRTDWPTTMWDGKRKEHMKVYN
jgi:hypothetical protein